MRISYALVFALLTASSATYAEVEKIAIPSEKGFSFYWWPKLAPIDGWHQDREHSFLYSANAMAPDGSTFKNAESVIYAKATFKPRAPEIKSLEALIDHDKRDFEASVPGVSIKEVRSIATADGQRLRSFTFFPKIDGNWEQVSYGEEGEYYLIFTVSSRSRVAFDAAAGSYEKIISGYKK